MIIEIQKLLAKRTLTIGLFPKMTMVHILDGIRKLVGSKVNSRGPGVTIMRKMF